MKNKASDKTSKENQELRRQIEVLKAQLRSTGGSNFDSQIQPRIESNPSLVKDKRNDISKIPQVSKEVMIDNSKYIKNDLIKTGILSIVMFAIIFGVFFSGKF